MPRKPLGARLYLRKERNGDKVWIIRDMKLSYQDRLGMYADGYTARGVAKRQPEHADSCWHAGGHTGR